MDNAAASYRRFLDGDDDGLREIIDEFYNGLTIYINGIVRNVSETEDIIEETFIKLAVKKPAYNGKAAFKTWLYTIARNCAINYIRKNKIKPVRLSDDYEEDTITLSDGTNVENEHLKTEQNVELMRAMKKLNPEYFQVLYLMYFEDLKVMDIAEVMKKSNRQVSILLYNAKNALKNIMERTGFNYENF